MSGPIFLETSTPRDRPQSLVELISLIQQYAMIELYGAPVPAESLLLKNQSTFIYAGLKGGLGGMALGVVLLPLSLAVLDTLVPVFGGGAKTPVADLYDRIWSFIMTFFWPLGYWALFVTQLAPVHVGRAPMRATNWLCAGWIAGITVKAVLGALLYHFMLFLVTPERLGEWLTDEGVLTLWTSPFWDLLDRLRFSEWYTRFYPLWITASAWLIGTSIGLSLTLLAALRVGHRYARQRYERNRLYEVLG
jgi:hypothetical protein